MCRRPSETRFEVTYNSKLISNLRQHNEVLILAFTLHQYYSRLNYKLLTCTLLALNLTVHSQCLIFELSKPKKVMQLEIRDEISIHAQHYKGGSKESYLPSINRGSCFIFVLLTTFLQAFA